MLLDFAGIYRFKYTLFAYKSSKLCQEQLNNDIFETRTIPKCQSYITPIDVLNRKTTVGKKSHTK
jgi:hypothetical protein